MNEKNQQLFSCARVWMVSSAKGGVGKSTVTASFGAALALRQKRVLLVDCDLTSRCLDLLLGVEDSIAYHIGDVLAGTVSVSDASVSLGIPNLSLLAGMMREENSFSTAENVALRNMITELAMNGAYDEILLDTPAGISPVTESIAAVSDVALIVTTGQTTAIRSAARTADILSSYGVTDLRLVVNQFPKDRESDESVALIARTVDEIGVQLLGVLPFEQSLWQKQNEGLLLCNGAYKKSHFATAVRRVAARACHVQVPLFGTLREH